jgi:homoserine O-acetyltransferase/O-succinyltransferase
MIVTANTLRFDSLSLDSGATLAPVEVTYEAYGELNEAKSNAILVLHAFSGDAHAAGISPETGQPGWWDNMIGPGKAFDTNKYFVICSNVLGGCRGTTGPASIDPATGCPYAMSFPVITIGDMVRLQAMLLDALGIQRLLAVTGGSMGGMQALEWAVAFPDRVVTAIPIASTTRHSAQQIAFNEVGRQAIMADPNWNAGNYYGKELPGRGLAVARMVGHITYMSDDSMREKFGRRLRGKEAFGFDFEVDFEVENYLRYRGSQFVGRFDANSYLYITKAMDYFDLTNGQRSLTAALEGVQGALPGDQLQLRLALPQLPIAGAGARPPLAQLRRGVCGARVQLRARFLPGGRGRAGRTGARIPGQHVRETGMSAHTVKKQAFVSELLGRSDYAIIGEIVEPNSKVLDLGCGEGELLEWLAQTKGVDARGVEISSAKVQRAIARGVSVFQSDIDAGLADYPDQAFDYVILSQTLQEMRHPLQVLREMLRVGRRGIVAFPNFGHWRVRFRC